MEKNSVTPHDMDWGVTTPDGFSEQDQQLLLVFNIDISSKANIERVIIFVVGKVLWLNKHVPVGTNHKIIFDLRGQPIAFLNRAGEMKRDVLEKVTEVDKSIRVVIEILI